MWEKAGELIVCALRCIGSLKSALSLSKETLKDRDMTLTEI